MKSIPVGPHVYLIKLSIFSLLSLFWKMKLGLRDLHAVCLWIPRINLWMPEPNFKKLGMHIMAPEPISTSYFINHSHQSVCLYVYPSCRWYADSVKCIPPFTARQRLGKHVPEAKNTRNNRRITGHMCLWVCLYIPLSLLGNNSVKTFPLQWKIVGGVVFYAVHVVSKESRRLFFPELLVYLFETFYYDVWQDTWGNQSWLYAVWYLICLLTLSATGSYQQWENTGLMRDELSQGICLESVYTLPKPRFGVTFSCLYKVSWQHFIHYANVVLNIVHCPIQTSSLQTTFRELLPRLSCDCHCTGTLSLAYDAFTTKFTETHLRFSPCLFVCPSVYDNSRNT
jgi:hypothetical protein